VDSHRQQTARTRAALPMRAVVPRCPAIPGAARGLGAALLPAAVLGALILGLGAAQAPAAQMPDARAPGAAVRAVAAGTTAGTIARDPVAARAPAAAAREVDLRETGYLNAVGEPGDTIDEQGRASGTYSCSISVHLTIVAAENVTAAFTVKPKGGSVTGRGSARFVQRGADGYFGGTIAITGGTGGFAHASGANIGISGVIDRETFALTVHVHGTIGL
jgi:hypothetical protein